MKRIKKAEKRIGWNVVKIAIKDTDNSPNKQNERES